MKINDILNLKQSIELTKKMKRVSFAYRFLKDEDISKITHETEFYFNSKHEDVFKNCPIWGDICEFVKFSDYLPENSHIVIFNGV